MKNKNLLAAGLLAAVFTVGGCSTILRGTHEKVEIVSAPEGALCSIYREGEGYLKRVAAPGAVYIPRSTAEIRVVCKKEGYQTTSVTAVPVKTGDIVGNVAAVGVNAVALGGTVLDIANNAHADLPDTIVVNLQKD